MLGRFQSARATNPKKATSKPAPPNLHNRISGTRVLTRILAQNTDEFCRHTTLHGLKYVGSRQLYPLERCFFGVSIVMVLLLSGFFIIKAYTKWATTPVIVGINPLPTFISNEPFPAVTICNLNQALKSKVIGFSNHSMDFATLQLLCKYDTNESITEGITDWHDLERFIINISQPCERMIISCRFGGLSQNCSQIFFPIVTDEGLCCVFNMLHPSLMFVSQNIPLTLRNITPNSYKPIDWYAEKGYPKNLPPRFYPRTTPAVGESMGLSLVLDVEYDEYYCSSSTAIGFKIALHSPNEAPNVRETGVLIEPGRESKLRIRPEKTETDRHLRSMNQKYRRCLFHDEGRLRYFAHYTQRNCECECVATIMHLHCGCIGYYMPRVDQNVSTCSVENTECAEIVRLRTDPTITSCLDACLPSCYDLTYLADVFAARLSSAAFTAKNERLQGLSQDYVYNNIAVVNMYFKEYSFRSSIKTEFIGIADFLSSVGGLMGLFLGFSFISIVELLYFGILRPWRAFFQQRRAAPTKSCPKMPIKRRSDKLYFNNSITSQRPYKLSPQLQRQEVFQMKDQPEKGAAIQNISDSCETPDNPHKSALKTPIKNWVLLKSLK